MTELLDEGAVQLLRHRHDDGSGAPILAAVGALQLDVVEFRLKQEYQVEVQLEMLSFNIARWVVPSDPSEETDSDAMWRCVEEAEKAGKLFGVNVCQDRWQRPVLLFRNPWKITQLQEEVKQLPLAPWAMPPKEYCK